ncbi:MAG TPA: YcxB family protein [Verrucomicrobiae bacterium]|nr:YcxB family protein [Verrucomicrobiae bacterium]
METKFEYQVSAEQAEKIALDQFSILLRLRGIKLIYFPILLAILISWMGASVTTGAIKINGVDHPQIVRIIGGVMGFAFGLGIGFLFLLSVRWTLRATARNAYNKMGSARTMSWNSDGIHFKSAALESKIGWRMIDKIEVGKAGVYGIMSKRPLFAIPKTVFPAGATVDDFIKAWQNGVRQPPIVTSAPRQ